MPVKNILSPKLKKLLNKSIESELYASNLYKHIGNCLQNRGFFGAQKYFLKESSEELKHYQIIVDFINNMGDKPEMPSVSSINEEIECIGDALEVAYETELKLLKQYNEYYKTADEEDCSVSEFLRQFIQIQVKSIGEYGDLLTRYEIAEKNNEILLFDKEMEGI